MMRDSCSRNYLDDYKVIIYREVVYMMLRWLLKLGMPHLLHEEAGPTKEMFEKNVWGKGSFTRFLPNGIKWGRKIWWISRQAFIQQYTSHL
jgi:hypothetical protein